MRFIPSKLLKAVFFITSAYYILPYFLKITTGVYENFYSSPISFDLDTIFVNWNTTFPGVTVCEIYNGEKIWDIAETYFSSETGKEHNLYLDDFIGEIAFYRGICTTCEKCAKNSTASNIPMTNVGVDKDQRKTNEIYCPTNYTELTLLFRSSCKQLLQNCYYSSKEVNCCDVFETIHTEYGICFAFNSKQARRIDQVLYASDRETGAGFLEFETLSDIQVHVHSPIEVPFPFSEGVIRETVLLGNNKEIILNVMEIHNHQSVSRVSLHDRRCRFSHERSDWGIKLDIYAFYSYSTCVAECALALQLQICDCGSHFLASAAKATAEIPVCDHQGLSCLSAHHYDLQEARKTCNCMSSCEEPEYDIVFNSPDDNTVRNENITSIRVALAELPMQRYVRRVTKDYLDLLISVGGIVGLFFNMSFIRLVEFLYLLREVKWNLLWRKLNN